MKPVKLSTMKLASSKKALRNQLQRHTEAFLGRGGKITVVPQGKRAL